jgi:pSer/pThr/pTyr-binding forkhead associated (FHA) protein
VVSGKHATISIEGGQLFVTDLQSRNLTYLDGQQLEPETAYEIPSGSTVTIAEFAIQVELGDTEPAQTEAPTVFEESYKNPFEQEAAKLAEVLERISALYEAEAPGRRDEALREATEEALGKSAAGESRLILERIVTSE